MASQSLNSTGCHDGVDDHSSPVYHRRSVFDFTRPLSLGSRNSHLVPEPSRRLLKTYTLVSISICTGTLADILRKTRVNHPSSIQSTQSHRRSDSPLSKPAPSQADSSNQAFARLTQANLNHHNKSTPHGPSQESIDRKERIMKAAKESSFEQELRHDTLPSQHDGKTPMEFWESENSQLYSY
ncbi:hypothetical protein BU16DRAFT_580070 [Lophium mytilinum]|uniref:Uncharacterized protein n=1 Tax=Lophium mytilinum TaxID=390894 RepID=A0A6A6QZ60_9PEZI|nr:hypothetical protein BU16DRAFT_580070 [Lophium mytilinum]